jgi:hypothetical protein
VINFHEIACCIVANDLSSKEAEVYLRSVLREMVDAILEKHAVETLSLDSAADRKLLRRLLVGPR